MRNLLFRTAAILCLLLFTQTVVKAQFLMDMIDTTTSLGKGMLGVYKKFDHIRSAVICNPNTRCFGYRDFFLLRRKFCPGSDNRFMLRRGRIRFDYAHFTKDSFPSIQFVFQFDGTERGVNIRDFWGRVWDTKWHIFLFTTGMFARPFGWEINLSSSDREAPERGRMSQILMKTERDLGAMVGFEPQRKDHPLKKLKIDAACLMARGLQAGRV
jgi:hypothetical protein